MGPCYASQRMSHIRRAKQRVVAAITRTAYNGITQQQCTARMHRTTPFVSHTGTMCQQLHRAYATVHAHRAPIALFVPPNIKLAGVPSSHSKRSKRAARAAKGPLLPYDQGKKIRQAQIADNKSYLRHAAQQMQQLAARRAALRFSQHKQDGDVAGVAERHNQQASVAETNGFFSRMYASVMQLISNQIHRFGLQGPSGDPTVSQRSLRDPQQGPLGDPAGPTKFADGIAEGMDMLGSISGRVLGMGKQHAGEWLKSIHKHRAVQQGEMLQFKVDGAPYPTTLHNLSLHLDTLASTRRTLWRAHRRAVGRRALLLRYMQRYGTAVSLLDSRIAPKEAVKQLHAVEYVIGLDDSGTGSLAGPLVTAACFFPPGTHFNILGIKDSKQLTEAERERAFQAILAMPGVRVATYIVDSSSVDRYNAHMASIMAMWKCLERLPAEVPSSTVVLVDGLLMPPGLSSYNAYVMPQGDVHAPAVAAASIIAKVTHDRMMRALHKRYPLYMFTQNKGYTSREHIQALNTEGVSPVHRRSVRPVKYVLNPHDPTLTRPMGRNRTTRLPLAVRLQLQNTNSALYAGRTTKLEDGHLDPSSDTFLNPSAAPETHADTKNDTRLGVRNDAEGLGDASRPVLWRKCTVEMQGNTLLNAHKGVHSAVVMAGSGVKESGVVVARGFLRNVLDKLSSLWGPAEGPIGAPAEGPVAPFSKVAPALSGSIAGLQMGAVQKQVVGSKGRHKNGPRGFQKGPRKGLKTGTALIRAVVRGKVSASALHDVRTQGKGMPKWLRSL